MIISSRHMLLVLVMPLASLLGCTTNTPLINNIAINSQRLDEQQWVLQQQTEKLNEIALAQHAFAKSLSDIQLHLKQIQVKVQEKTPKKKQKLKQAEATHLMASKVENSKTTVGRNEWVWIDLVGQTFKARVDTGALSSALHANNIQAFERNGKKWVRFTLSENENSEEFSRPLVRYVQVRHSSTEQLDRRPVITLTVRMGDIVEETEFTLNNRAKMLYPVLLGRDFLRDIVIVDVAKKFTQSKYKAKVSQE